MRDDQIRACPMSLLPRLMIRLRNFPCRRTDRDGRPGAHGDCRGRRQGGATFDMMAQAIIVRSSSEKGHEGGKSSRLQEGRHADIK